MRFRERFSKEARALKKEERLNRNLVTRLEKLLAKIDKHRNKGKMEEVMFASQEHEECDVIKNLACYKRLHEMCEAANVQIKSELRNYCGSLYPAIVIVLNKPYSSSPDAGILAPKPAWVQPELPGL
jgi:hypothetical protein